MGLLWLKMRLAAVGHRREVSLVCVQHHASIDKTWFAVKQHSYCAAGPFSSQLPWLGADRMFSNQSPRESFSRWYYTFCSRGAGIQGDLSRQSSFRHSKPVAYECS